jgi:transcription initiation factor TFIIIB Brf1 subunit/transcription initiation factor TFIIB
MASILDTIDTENLDDDEIEEILDRERMLMKLKSQPKKNECVGCLGTNVIDDVAKGCKKCLDCGICDVQLYDEKPEWSVYEDGKNDGNIRCSGATNFFFPKSSLGTIMGGNKYSSLRRVQGWISMPYKELALSKILKIIDHCARKMNLPKSVIDNAKILYNDIHRVKHLWGEKTGKNVIIRGIRNRFGLYGACIYYGAQYQGYSRQCEEIAQAFDIPVSIIKNGNKRLKELLPDNIMLNSVSSMTSDDFMERYAYKLNFSKEDVKSIVTISRNVTKLQIAANHQPISITAGIIMTYADIYGVPIDYKEVTDMFKITMVTMEKIYNKIIPFKKVIISDELTDLVRGKLIEAKYIMLNPDES